MTDKNPKQSEVEKEDRYLGRVQGNILDAYQNSTYTLKLYMIPDLTSDGGGYLKKAKSAEPQNTVIIAQTSVTGVQIDDLSIDIKKGASGAFATSAQFTLIQPGAADLLDQIQAAKKHLGIQAGVFAPVPLFLEINFKGYKEDLDDLEGGGEIETQIAGPYIYECHIATVDVSITDAGSTYDFFVTIGDDESWTDKYYTLPADTSFTGDTITECFDSLTEALENYTKNNKKEELISDEIVFDLSQLKEVLGDDSIKYSNYKDAEQLNRLMNAESYGIKSREEFEKMLEDSPESLDGGIEATGGFWRRDRIQVPEGTNFHRILSTMLVMNEAFLDKSSRKKGGLDNPVIDEHGLDLNQTFTYWYKMTAEMEYIENGYDARRNAYARRVTYKPIIYKTADQDNNLSQSEFKLSKENVTKRVNELLIKKAYHYLYTGLNDQILSADISYKAGQVLLAAPGGGYLGDSSSSPNAPGSPSTDGDNEGKERQAKTDAAVEDPTQIAKKLKDDDQYFDKIADRLNLTEEEKKNLRKDKEQRNRLAQTINYLQSGGQNPTDYYQTAASDNNSDTTPTNDFDGTYKPEPSGFIYSAELMHDAGGSPTVIGELTDQQVTNSLANALKGDEADVGPLPGMVYDHNVIVNNSNTSDGGAKGTLFGYMYQNVNDASILVDLGLKVRGDPWYLGPPEVDPKAPKLVKKANEEEEDSTDQYIVYNRSDNYFLFTMQTPRVRDPNVDDEDENSGYMSQQGTAFFLSGVYQIFGITANFSGGMFEIETNAKKQTALSLAKLDMTQNSYDGADN